MVLAMKAVGKKVQQKNIRNITYLLVEIWKRPSNLHLFQFGS